MNTNKVNNSLENIANLGNLANINNTPENVNQLQNLITNLSSNLNNTSMNMNEVINLVNNSLGNISNKTSPIINTKTYQVDTENQVNNYNQVNSYNQTNQVNTINESDLDYQNKATQPVDYCRLRPLDEIKSEMCEPSPTECIKPAVTKTAYQECAMYRYEAPEVIINKINKDGFYVFRNMISKDELEVCKKYFFDDKVNYNRLRDEFINPSMLKKVGNEIKRKLVNVKYRASNNNNSSDAAGFHRDLKVKSGEERVNCFTILTYVDGGVMQLIPESNRNQQINLLQLNQYFNSAVEIKLNPGDVLMFEMTTIHRGIFYKKQESRRLIQLFDTVFEEELNYFLKTVLHVPCRDNCNKSQSEFLINLNKNKTLSNILNRFIFFNSAIGYSKLPMKYITSVEGVKYISTDTNQPRVVIENDTFQKDNLYALNFPVKEIHEHERDRYIFLNFLLNQILLFVLICVIIAIVMLTVNLVFKD